MQKNATHRVYDFVQLDVFTRTPLKGNPLAIFPDARGLNDEEMQALAREMNLSETTFILPREPGTEAQLGKKVRIFTVQEELPFAGHPTLGTALYLHSLGDRPDEIALDLKVGKVPVCFTVDTKNESRDGVDGGVFGEMRQRNPEFGAKLPREEVARAIGIDVREISSEWPIQVVSTGLPFAIVPLRTSEAMAKLKFDFAQAASYLETRGTRFFYFLFFDDTRNAPEARARMFFYGGEDPATGSAAGCAASWMSKYGIIKNNEQLLIRQGVEAGRASEIFVRAVRADEKVTNVRVGGYAVEIVRGQISF